MFGFKRQEPADVLLYADTEITEVDISKNAVTVSATEYDNTTHVRLHFLGGRVIEDKTEESSRVEDGQIVRLRNGAKRLILFDDDGILILELEYQQSKEID